MRILNNHTVQVVFCELSKSEINQIRNEMECVVVIGLPLHTFINKLIHEFRVVGYEVSPQAPHTHSPFIPSLINLIQRQINSPLLIFH